MEINSTKRISLNVITTIIQVFVVGIIYFFLYSYLVDKLGVEKLGVWSIILATSSMANIANFGITSGLVKFIAEYNSLNKTNEIAKLIFTAFFALLVFFIFIIFIIYFFSKKILFYIVDINFLDLSISILPYSLICLLLNSIAGVFTSTLEGFQKNYIKNILFLFSNILFLFLTFYLVPKYDLKGVAFSQVFQSIFILFFSYVFSYQATKNFIFDKWNWDKQIFLRLLGYGTKFQLISIFQLFYEPITKSLMSKFGGLAFLGYYEMSARLVNQIRSLIVSANQVIVPVIAHTNTVGKEEIKKIYKTSLLIVFFVSISLFSMLILFTPIISHLWIGYEEKIFIFSTILLSISMFVNILIGPAYFSCIGEGNLNPILKSQIMIGVLNLILGFLFGVLYGGYGVIIGWSIAVSISSIYLFYYYHSEKKISKEILFNKLNLKTSIQFFIVLFFGNFFFKECLNYFENIYLICGIYIIIYLIILSIVVKNNLYIQDFAKTIIKSIKKQ